GERLVPEKNRLSVSNGGDSTPLVLDKEFRTLAFSDDGEAQGELVFAGYGLSVPEAPGQARYNSYDGIDVKDKIVLILRYVPEDVEPARRAHLNRYGGLRYKAMMARERGAKAVLVVTGLNSPNAGELLPLAGDGSSAGSGIIAASISGDVAAALLSPGGKNLKDLQKALDNENPHAEVGFVLPKVKVKIATSVEHIHKMDRNVVGCIPGDTDEWIIVGAHYDHLGLGKGNSSLARTGEEGKIHYGADDNASGTAAVIEIAAALNKDAPKPKRGIIFALWSGEEIGLIGSHSFVEKPPVELAKVVAYVNFDMVGRLKENKLTMQAVGSSKSWLRLLEKRNVAAGFQLGLQEDPYLPTDVTSFYPKRVPVLNFFTGSHEDYHRPSDTADKINYEGLERIARFAEAIVRDVAMASERPDFSRVERKEQGGGRDTMRAYLGSIPDYATEVKGVKLSGVRGGSPAEKGGLKGGDVIVEFGAQKIANIYDYTYALDAVKIGQPVKMTVEREGKRIELTVTPEARK
ncbi:MAG: M20/M25/M40 family metallo-hydrolase, partial [Chthoniobacteraceae bacterium]